MIFLDNPWKFHVFFINTWKIRLLFLQYPWKFHILNLPVFFSASNQILSTAGFEFFLSGVCHWLFHTRINTNETLVARPEMNESIIFPIRSIPKMLLFYKIKNCFWVSNKMNPLGLCFTLHYLWWKGVSSIIYINQIILLASYHKMNDTRKHWHFLLSCFQWW